MTDPTFCHSHACDYIEFRASNDHVIVSSYGCWARCLADHSTIIQLHASRLFRPSANQWLAARLLICNSIHLYRRPRAVKDGNTDDGRGSTPGRSSDRAPGPGRAANSTGRLNLLGARADQSVLYRATDRPTTSDGRYVLRTDRSPLRQPLTGARCSSWTYACRC